MENEKYITLIIKLLERNRNRAKEIYYLLIGFLERWSTILSADNLGRSSLSGYSSFFSNFLNSS